MRVLFCSTRAVAATARSISMYRTKHTDLFRENICCLEVSFAVLGSVILLYARIIAVSA